MATERTPLTEGTPVKVTGLSGPVIKGFDKPETHGQFRVWQYVPVGEGDICEDYEDGNTLPYYLLDGEDSLGGSHWAYAEDVEEIPAEEVEVCAYAEFFSIVHHSVQGRMTRKSYDDGLLDGWIEEVSQAGGGMPIGAAYMEDSHPLVLIEDKGLDDSIYMTLGGSSPLKSAHVLRELAARLVAEAEDIEKVTKKSRS